MKHRKFPAVTITGHIYKRLQYQRLIYCITKFYFSGLSCHHWVQLNVICIHCIQCNWVSHIWKATLVSITVHIQWLITMLRMLP